MEGTTTHVHVYFNRMKNKNDLTSFDVTHQLAFEKFFHPTKIKKTTTTQKRTKKIDTQQQQQQQQHTQN